MKKLMLLSLALILSACSDTGNPADKNPGRSIPVKDNGFPVEETLFVAGEEERLKLQDDQVLGDENSVLGLWQSDEVKDFSTGTVGVLRLRQYTDYVEVSARCTYPDGKVLYSKTGSVATVDGTKISIKESLAMRAIYRNSENGKTYSCDAEITGGTVQINLQDNGMMMHIGTHVWYKIGF